MIPLFHERDADGIPRRWLAMVKHSLRTNGPRFSAARMVEEYAATGSTRRAVAARRRHAGAPGAG